MALSESEREEKAFLLGRAFKPATPINSKKLFAGRKSQIRDLIDAINSNGQHVVLYGERGVGKTSLANMLFPNLQCPSYEVLTPQINCTHQDTFAAIWKRVFEEVQFLVEENDEIDLSDDVTNLLADYTQQYADDLSPDVIRRLLVRLRDIALVAIIIDEFDCIESDETRQTMADTIKFLSDRNVPGTVVLIGVAEDVEGLIALHHSTERCILQVRMPRMMRGEIVEVLETCYKQVDMSIEVDASKDIACIARGLPHYAHLLGLHAGRAAVAQGALVVRQEQVLSGIETALDKVQASIQATYRRAISSARKDAQYKEVLLACALAPTDEFGYFSPVDVRNPLSEVRKVKCKIEGFARHLHAFAEPERGPILKKDAPSKGRPRFRFNNPLIQPYVLLKGVAEGMIKEDDLRSAGGGQDANGEQGTLFV